MKNGNWVLSLGQGGTGNSLAASTLHFLGLLPAIPRASSPRNKMADVLLAMFVLLARFAIIVGAALGVVYTGVTGIVLGTLTGGVVGFWIRRSVGLRGRDLTHGFFIRMGERGMGSSPGLLESLVERIGGRTLTPYQCRLLASAYAEFHRALQSCGSIAERDELCKTLKRKILVAFSGDQETAVGGSEDGAISKG